MTDPTPRHIVFFSGGAASYCAAKRVIAAQGTDDVALLFTDTLMEDDDLYRFLDEAVEKLAVPLIRLCEGRTPWEVFRDERYLGNTRIDPCSRILKRELSKAWVEEHCDVKQTTLYLGMDWSEAHRAERAEAHWKPWNMKNPLLDRPLLDKCKMLEILEADGLEPPRLYKLGFPHNNCGGFCIKAGQAHFAHLLQTLPDRYAYHEEQEQSIRDMLGDVSILRDRRGGTTKPMSLCAFRKRVEDNPDDFDETEWGGCGCFVGEEE